MHVLLEELQQLEKEGKLQNQAELCSGYKLPVEENTKKQLDMKYTLFVDESGDAGITKVRTSSSGGASPYMVLGGAILENSSAERIKESLSNIRDEIGKGTLHCSDLNHPRLTYFARTIAREDMCLFGVIS